MAKQIKKRFITNTQKKAIAFTTKCEPKIDRQISDIFTSSNKSKKEKLYRLNIYFKFMDDEGNYRTAEVLKLEEYDASEAGINGIFPRFVNQVGYYLLPHFDQKPMVEFTFINYKKEPVFRRKIWINFEI